MGAHFWWQALGLFWVAVCFFTVGARSKGIAVTWREIGGIVQLAVVTVALFGLVTEGAGCRSLGGSTLDVASAHCAVGAAC